MKLYPWTLLMVGVPKHHFANKQQSLRGTLHSLGFVRVMSAFCWDSHHQFLGDCFFLTSSYQKQKSASCLVVTLGKRKAANEMCQRYTDNKLPSSLGKARTWSNIAMENPLFPIGNSFTNCGFSMAMLDYRRVRSWLEIPAIVDDCLATR